METSEQNMIYMNDAENFNDPFDCLGVWWDTSILKDISEKQGLNFSVDYLDDHMDVMFKNALTPLKITCFSSELYNLPLWGNYAESGSGFVVEYNFRELNIDSEFTKYLYPVIYREEREDISKVLKLLFEVAVKEQGEFHPLLRLLFYKNLIKHISWSYEREWRLLFLENDNHVKLPIKPTAIYITDRCNEGNEDCLKLISQKLNCDLIRLTPTRNNKSFIFTEALVQD
ncbi:DUF2971 domain-containing protein [Bacillus pumilus]|uniref:DUF2971 domain-containing protein n=1 Tax=Bacillus pumilus TaxID=1408 RepID=UPI00316AD549